MYFLQEFAEDLMIVMQVCLAKIVHCQEERRTLSPEPTQDTVEKIDCPNT